MCVSLRSIKEAIESTSRKVVPGLLELVNLYCNLTLRSNYLEVLTSNPEYIVEILKKLYTPEIAELVVREVFITPIVSITGKGDPRRLAELAIRDPIMFREELKKLLVTLS